MQSLVTVVVVWVLTKIWQAGQLQELLLIFWRSFRSDEGMTSADMASVGLLQNAVYAAGIIAILQWSGLWPQITELFDNARRALLAWLKSRLPQERPAEDLPSDPIVDAIEVLAETQKDIVRRLGELEAK